MSIGDSIAVTACLAAATVLIITGHAVWILLLLVLMLGAL